MKNLLDIELDKIVSLAECRAILCAGGKAMSDEELIKIRQLLIFFAQIDIRNFKSSCQQMDEIEKHAA